VTSDRKVLFGLGLENGVHQVSEMLGHAHVADDAGLDLFSLNDHPYFAEHVDAYAAPEFPLGATSNITGAVIMTNLLSRPAPILARTVTGLSTISGGRVVLDGKRAQRSSGEGFWPPMLRLTRLALVGSCRSKEKASMERWRLPMRPYQQRGRRAIVRGATVVARAT
jgi:hypothetical protein